MKKGKEVSISASPNPKNADNVSNNKDAAHQDITQPSKRSIRNASSKYDFVKVKVWLGDNADHYYVLSRFLLSRMLTVTKIPNHVAIKIALELKKLLIDNSLLDVSHSDLEANLFKLMERRGYGEEYINRYKMMTRFHHMRVPLVILVCGTACTGKSTIATQLAQRLNLPNVLQTDMVYELLRTSTEAPLVSTPVWARDFSSPEELITEFCRECRIVRKGLAGDLRKAMKDGKPIIIEGIHLDPSIYLMDNGNRETPTSTTKNERPNPVPDASRDGAETEHIGVPESTLRDVPRSINHCPASKIPEEICADVLPGDLVCKESISTTGVGPRNEGSIGDNLNNLMTKPTPPLKKETSSGDPIIVPIVLKMAEFDHKALLEEWISARMHRDKCLDQDQSKLIDNLKIIQDYLCSFESQGLTVVNNSATTFPQTLDWLHGYLLQCIERGTSSASNAKKTDIS